MTHADAFPAASPQEKQKLVEAPDFIAQTERLEAMAMDGIETAAGSTESMQFRAGIEVEFALIDPAKYREWWAERLESSDERLAKRIADDPGNEELIRKNQEETLQSSNEFEMSQLLNPDKLEGDKTDTTDLLVEFKQYAEDFVKRLPVNNDAEEERRKQWLEQIPDFGTREIINFLLYEEFSKPTLAEVKPPVGGTLEELDAYSEQQGWLEFRFGNGTFQTGYYDNEGMCEIRQAPCIPSESLRRKEAVQLRLLELADQFGVLVQSSSNHEHVNLSVYGDKEGSGEYTPIIGLDDSRRPRTLDIATGMSKAFGDGLWLNAKDMKWDYLFNQPHGGTGLRIGPTRKSIRIMDDVIELRSGFKQADQATNWLMAGAIVGLQEGHAAIKAEGYEVPEEATIYQVHRQPDFDKQVDLHIQRAFENATNSNGKFALDDGFNFIRGEEITHGLLGTGDEAPASDTFNSMVFAGIELDQEGIPFVVPEKMKQHYDGMSDFLQRSAEKVMGLDFNEIAAAVNPRLTKVKLEPTTVITGEAKYSSESREAAYDRLRTSEVARIALGDELDKDISWLQTGVPKAEAA